MTSLIAEASYLLDRELGPVADVALFRSIVDGDLRVETLLPTDSVRITELVEEYSDLRRGVRTLQLLLLVNALGLNGSPP